MERYSDIILDHYEHPRNVGDMADADALGAAFNPVCGDTMMLSLRIQDGRITETRFRTEGCVAAVGVSSVVTELLVGRSLSEARGVTREQMAEAAGGLPASKIHASVLVADALKR
ncbi:MAG: iron-sulfur cluster assembly scaffold protein, partial [Chloroflexi bacterium]|nr:iron-sulfur cluster assembly scaffold protein [Chloroflexota bacterium]